MRINKLLSRLSIGFLLATTVTIAAKPAQALKPIIVDFDEVNVGLEAKDNPFLDNANKIDNLWADQGLTISSDRNELWLYDTSTKGGEDDDLLTGKGKWGKIEYDSEEQGKVLIIQEYHKNEIKDFNKFEEEISKLKKDIKDLNTKIKEAKNNKDNKLKKKLNGEKKKIKNQINKIEKKRDKLLSPDDNFNKNTRFKDDFADKEYQDNKSKYKGGSIKFDFTDTNKAGEEVGVLFNSIGLLDLDEHLLPEFMVKFAGGDELIKFKFDERDKNVVKTSRVNNTEILTLASSEYVTQMTRQRATEKKYVTDKDGNVVKDKNGKKKTKNVKTDENSLRQYEFDFGDKRVTEFYVNLSGSGAITDLTYFRDNAKKFAKARVPEPTSILGLVAVSGLAASSLKRKRKSLNSELTQ